MKKLPTAPDYLPLQEIARMEWGIQIAAALILLGAKYNIAQTLIDAVTANTVIIKAFYDNFKMTKKFMADLVTNKQSLLLVNKPDPNPLIDLAKLPKFIEWPAGGVSVAALLNPHVEAAELLVANVNLTANDRTAFRLDKLKPVPSKRKTAEDFNYPLISYVVEDNMVKLTIKRGNRWKGWVCRVVMATGDSSKFNLVTNTAKQVVEVPVEVPEGKLAVTLVFQAVYMDGNNTKGDWSPYLVVAVGKPNEPEMAMAA